MSDCFSLCFWNLRDFHPRIKAKHFHQICNNRVIQNSVEPYYSQIYKKNNILTHFRLFFITHSILWWHTLLIRSRFVYVSCISSSRSTTLPRPESSPDTKWPYRGSDGNTDGDNVYRYHVGSVKINVLDNSKFVFRWSFFTIFAKRQCPWTRTNRI